MIATKGTGTSSATMSASRFCLPSGVGSITRSSMRFPSLYSARWEADYQSREVLCLELHSQHEDQAKAELVVEHPQPAAAPGGDHAHVLTAALTCRIEGQQAAQKHESDGRGKAWGYVSASPFTRPSRLLSCGAFRHPSARAPPHGIFGGCPRYRHASAATSSPSPPSYPR